jgi:hypothetical protein
MTGGVLASASALLEEIERKAAADGIEWLFGERCARRRQTIKNQESIVLEGGGGVFGRPNEQSNNSARESVVRRFASGGKICVGRSHESQPSGTQ